MGERISVLGLIVTALILVCPSFATKSLVPDEYATIQAAIDAAENDDIVIVEPNTYTGAGNKNLDFGGRAITVRSIDPNDPVVVAATI